MCKCVNTRTSKHICGFKRAHARASLAPAVIPAGCCSDLLHDCKHTLGDLVSDLPHTLISAAMLKVTSGSLHYQPSGHRTESHIPVSSLSFSPSSRFPLCRLPTAVLSSAIPSRLLCPVLHLSGVCVLFYFPPLCHGRSGSLLSIRSSFFLSFFL